MSAGTVTIMVELLNDEGEQRFEYGEANDVDVAVALAEQSVRRQTGDESYCMTDWAAA